MHNFSFLVFPLVFKLFQTLFQWTKNIVIVLDTIHTNVIIVMFEIKHVMCAEN